MKWLEEMASLGFRLVRVWPAIYFFERAEPESVHFCHGFGKVKSKDRDEYFQIYADAGWQYVSSILDWHYFRSSVATANDMDRATVIRGNAKFFRFMASIYLVMTVLFPFWIGFLWIKGEMGERALLINGVMGIGFLGAAYFIFSYVSRRQLANLEKIKTK